MEVFVLEYLELFTYMQTAVILVCKQISSHLKIGLPTNY